VVVHASWIVQYLFGFQVLGQKAYLIAALGVPNSAGNWFAVEMWRLELYHSKMMPESNNGRVELMLQEHLVIEVRKGRCIEALEPERKDNGH
jgi:hypothetical protein